MTTLSRLVRTGVGSLVLRVLFGSSCLVRLVFSESPLSQKTTEAPSPLSHYSGSLDRRLTLVFGLED